MAEVQMYMRSLTPSWSGYPPWGMGPACLSPEAQEEWLKDSIPEVSTITQSSCHCHDKWKIQPVPAAKRLPGGKALVDHMAANLIAQEKNSSAEEETIRLIEGTLITGRIRLYKDAYRAEVYQIG